jgi:hypothetical protein
LNVGWVVALVAVHDLEGLSVDDLEELCLHLARSWDQAGIVAQVDEFAFDDRGSGGLQSLREIGLIADPGVLAKRSVQGDVVRCPAVRRVRHALKANLAA